MSHVSGPCLFVCVCPLSSADETGNVDVERAEARDREVARRHGIQAAALVITQRTPKQMPRTKRSKKSAPRGFGGRKVCGTNKILRSMRFDPTRTIVVVDYGGSGCFCFSFHVYECNSSYTFVVQQQSETTI